LESKSTVRRPILIWLIVSQLLALASLFFWLFAAGISVMAFDSGVTPEAWTFVIAVGLIPFGRSFSPLQPGSLMLVKGIGWQPF
jgi:hypothetical protein